MSAQEATVIAALCRSNLAYFLLKVFEELHPGAPPLRLAWYIRAICHALEDVQAGRTRRLVITVPPRHLKSITASVAWVAYLLGQDPSLKIMVASYSQDLAREHSNLTRRIMEGDWYKALFPGTRISDAANRALEFKTTAGGGRKAVSVGGPTTGFGADIIIVDDCMKADDVRSAAMREEARNWFDGTLMTRLNDKERGVIVSIQQRLHEDDLPAYLLAKGYEHLNLPAIAEKDEQVPISATRDHYRKVGDLLDPQRESRAVLDQLRRELGPAVFAAQYQQDPVAPEGNLLRLEWFGTYEEEPERHDLLKVIQSWDTAMTADARGDWSVCVTAGFERRLRKWLILDVFRDHLEYPDLKRAMIRQYNLWKPDMLLVEDANAGKSLCQEFRVHRAIRPKLVSPHGSSKEERFTGCLGEIEAGNFLLPREAPWLDAFKAELKAFPMGRNDDQVDAFSQLVLYQLPRWRWILTPYDEKGRGERMIRLRERPW
jgi:predicted phage terminase large subunit-like protein